ncbi:uncharacterized protein GGS22DRAFT_185027 [Annulohypoxylon maeteangense]|uniref:uncharacterized protein n=1 Tax=Annulohypoxylon maeteangense TaxID=1927788 RepID=UPI002007F381|nr:uncharacterized protein GGS22DRAFT_185027 [Annulohypoxylon maeteangense]KAI0889448.1 hypothetical protein GGS22DRAFT_185027 [Annulohypoxylon maeteangense]
MLARVSTVAIVLAFVAQIFAAPVAQPANFETDPMLQVGQKADSSYAEGAKRANFEAGPLLGASAYAKTN